MIRVHTLVGLWFIFLLILTAWATAPVHAETFLDRLPFKLDFQTQSGPFPGRSGRYGRPQKAIDTMEYPNTRAVWDRHPYPGNMLILTFPF